MRFVPAIFLFSPVVQNFGMYRATLQQEGMAGLRRAPALAALVLLSASLDRHSPLQIAAASGLVILPVAAGATQLRASPSHRFVGNVGLSGKLRLRGGEGEVGNIDGSIQLPLLRSMLDLSTSLTNASTTEGAGEPYHSSQTHVQLCPANHLSGILSSTFCAQDHHHLILSTWIR